MPSTISGIYSYFDIHFLSIFSTVTLAAHSLTGAVQSGIGAGDFFNGTAYADADPWYQRQMEAGVAGSKFENQIVSDLISNLFLPLLFQWSAG